MPETAAGRSYTSHEWENDTGDPSIWGIADDLLNTTYRKPVYVYCHGNGGNYDAFTNGAQYKRMKETLINYGWVYIETLGHSVSHWGREFAMESYSSAIHEVADIHPLGTVVLHGRSMGGTVSSSLALKPEWGLSKHVSGLILESAVQSLEYRHVTMGKSLNGQYPDGRSTPEGYEAFMTASEPFDPMRFDTSLYENMPVQFIHGTADDNVWPNGHCIPQFERIRDIAPYADLYMRGLGTHSTGESKDDEMYNPMWKFARRAMGLYPEYVTLRYDEGRSTTRGTYYRPGWRIATPLS